MKRIFVLLLLILSVAGCVPQWTGTGPLAVEVTGPDAAVITLHEDVAIFGAVIYIGGAASVMSTQLSCESFEVGHTCELAERIEPPVNLVIQADAVNPYRISASAWYSVPGQRDRIARATAY